MMGREFSCFVWGLVTLKGFLRTFFSSWKSVLTEERKRKRKSRGGEKGNLEGEDDPAGLGLGEGDVLDEEDEIVDGKVDGEEAEHKDRDDHHVLLEDEELTDVLEKVCERSPHTSTAVALDFAKVLIVLFGPRALLDKQSSHHAEEDDGDGRSNASDEVASTVIFLRAGADVLDDGRLQKREDDARGQAKHLLKEDDDGTAVVLGHEVREETKVGHSNGSVDGAEDQVSEEEVSHPEGVLVLKEWWTPPCENPQEGSRDGRQDDPRSATTPARLGVVTELSHDGVRDAVVELLDEQQHRHPRRRDVGHFQQERAHKVRLHGHHREACKVTRSIEHFLHRRHVVRRRHVQ